jgi:hypothetical protein
MSELLVRDTKLSNVRRGDVILYRAEGIMNGDFLGELIADLEGGSLRLTHAAMVRDVPDPNAKVIQVGERNGIPIFKVEERRIIETIMRETPFYGESKYGQILRNTMGVKLEATFPKCREWSISEWDSEFIQIYRIRNLTPQNIEDIIRMQQDMVGFESFDTKGNHPEAWDYNIAEFLTYGLLNQAAAKICSQFIAEPVYMSTLLRGCANGNYALPMTLDLRGNRDPEITPNDLILSGFAWPVPFQGLL